VRIWLKGTVGGDVTVEVREAKSGNLAGHAKARLTAAAEQVLDLIVPVANCHAWSPEDPFLYQITATTAGDEFKTRFGMREFKFDPVSKRAMLNGKPYFMRGSNITLYRFFEDPDRGILPWDRSWIRTLHQRAKEMNWNCLRYCIGFPPEAWYEIADEEGLLIQDEFPLWIFNKGDRPGLEREGLASEYTEWMQERWNHPCVVIWDASNETHSTEHGPAVQQVRGLDLSKRPWDYSYTAAMEPGDTLESHPYHFSNPGYKLRDLGLASAGADPSHAVIINEYGWLWLNRDGSPTVLTENLYKNLAPKSTAAERFRIQASYMAAETEFWRAHRKAAAVMHFTMLGYTRPDGFTSDHWSDVKKLTWESEFRDWTPDSFAPVGLMLNCFEAKGTTIPIILINDLKQPWDGPVTLLIRHNGKLVSKLVRNGRIAEYGTATLEFPVTWPTEEGEIQVEAGLDGAGGKTVRSRRNFQVKLPIRSLAYQRPVTASSIQGGEYEAANAVDGDEDTYWSSAFTDPAWLSVDLGAIKPISRVAIVWEDAYAKVFTVEISTDDRKWTEVYASADGKGGTTEIKTAPANARWVRVHGIQRASPWGYAIRELRVLE
jgi:beta-galactosidase